MCCKEDVLAHRKEYMEFTVENYDFKKAMQQLINEKLKGILLKRGFVQYKKNFYARERKDIVQIIYFALTKDELYVWAYFLPIFVPLDAICNYGGDFFGCYEREKIDKEKQLESYYKIQKPNFGKMADKLIGDILPEMERINSLAKLIENVMNDGGTIFGKKYGSNRKVCDFDFYMLNVYKCITDNFQSGKEQLLNYKCRLKESGEWELPFEKNIYSIIEYLFPDVDMNDGRKVFLERYNIVCSEMRKKYKLV